ncbi:hypothetical protein Nepgr_003412 [Nepenthes gracilis]|uniref:Uncharacterized protein n=1 Tax=Nepenthes gracilis TaxID=150966 RepID=A0AAD3XDJ7_NEPGR|nr:hypothetical protein Nepgr_003412 [Nepenthes gracilis]
MGDRKLATMTRVMERANNTARWSKDYFEDALCYKLFKGSCNELPDVMASRGMNMIASDPPIHMDRIAKIPAVENHFIGLPETSKNHLCYGALLNC